MDAYENLEEYLQSLPEWESDTRMRALFSCFKPRNLNPENWDHKFQFWATLIKKACWLKLLSGNRLVIEGKDLKDLSAKFKRNGLTPLSIDVVLHEMLERKELVDISSYGTEVAGPSSLISYFTSIFTYSFSVIRNIVQSPPAVPHSKDYPTVVLHAAVKDVTQSIIENITKNKNFSNKSHVFTFNQFSSIVSSITSKQFSETDFAVILLHLQQEGLATMKVNESDLRKQIIKINVNKPAKSKAQCLSEIDHGIGELKLTVERLNEQIAEVMDKIDRLNLQIKKYLQKNQKSIALLTLKQRKEFEKLHEKRMNSLFSVENILHKIESSKTDADVLKAYSVGTATLSNVIREQGLTMENVENVMDKLEDILADHEEIEQAMVNGQKSINGELDQDLEKELNDLVLSQSQIPDVSQEAQSPSVEELLNSLENLEIKHNVYNNVETKTKTENDPAMLTN